MNLMLLLIKQEKSGAGEDSVAKSCSSRSPESIPKNTLQLTTAYNYCFMGSNALFLRADNTPIYVKYKNK